MEKTTLTHAGFKIKIEIDPYPTDFDEEWGYEIWDQEGNFIDSCWGFDDYEFCLKTAKEEAAELSAYIKDQDKKIERMMHT